MKLVSPLPTKQRLLRDLPVFADLRRSQLRALETLFDELHVPAGQTLVRQGELPREFLVVVAGNATVERDGRTIGNVGPGAFVGEMALLGPRTRRNATVTALTDMVILVADGRTLDAVLDVDTDLRTSVERVATQRAARNAA